MYRIIASAQFEFKVVSHKEVFLTVNTNTAISESVILCKNCFSSVA